MFEIQPMNPEHYRQQTRRSTLLVVLIFAVLGMLCATASNRLFGTPGWDNFQWNLLGVLAGLVLTIALVRQQLWSRPVMAAAVYGWQLKRHLMQVTNRMHRVQAGVAAGDATAMKVLSFYHLGVTQMHQLDGNSGELSQMVREIDSHCEAMQQRGLDTEQRCFDPRWLESL